MSSSRPDWRVGARCSCSVELRTHTDTELKTRTRTIRTNTNTSTSRAEPSRVGREPSRRPDRVESRPVCRSKSPPRGAAEPSRVEPSALQYSPSVYPAVRPSPPPACRRTGVANIRTRKVPVCSRDSSSSRRVTSSPSRHFDTTACAATATEAMGNLTQRQEIQFDDP